MKSVMALAPFVVALPIVIGSAIWQGRQTERWGQFPELSVAAKRVDLIPLEVGDWKGKLGPKFDDQIRAAAGAEGDSQIVYTNAKTHEQVSVLVVCGRLEDVYDHRPDRCYPAHGYIEEGERTRKVFATEGGGAAEFQVATYAHKDVNTLSRVYWAWSKDGKWLGPDDALHEDFAQTDPMFKVQIETGVNDPRQSLDDGPAVELIKVFIPELSKSLFEHYKPPVAKPVKS